MIKFPSCNLDELLRLFGVAKVSFDMIEFKNGYNKDAPTLKIEFKGIDIGAAKSEWSDNWQGNAFRIKLGEIIK